MMLNHGSSRFYIIYNWTCMSLIELRSRGDHNGLIQEPINNHKFETLFLCRYLQNLFSCAWLAWLKFDEGLAQDYGNSVANVLELAESCSKQSNYFPVKDTNSLDCAKYWTYPWVLSLYAAWWFSLRQRHDSLWDILNGCIICNWCMHTKHWHVNKMKLSENVIPLGLTFAMRNLFMKHEK